MTFLCDLTAYQVAERVRSGGVSAREVVQSCVDRIERTDGRLKAWVRLDFERAFEDAAEADRVRPKRGPRGPLDGVPFGVKDVLDVRGLATEAGFAPYNGNVADADAEAVARLRAAGGIPLGKLSTAQFAVSDPPETLNPWNEALSPGGSSTGSGVAVAARHVPLALGTQTGGSILRPAAFNGVVGYKPSRGVVPQGGLVPTAPSLDHVGVLARSVEDCRLFLSSAAGDAPSVGDGHGVGPDAPPRLGLIVESLDATDEPIKKAVMQAIDDLGAAGALVEEIDLGFPFEALAATYRIIMQSEIVALHTSLFQEHRDHYGPQLQAYLDAGRLIPGWVTVTAQALRSRFAEAVGSIIAQSGVEALILPVVPTGPPHRASTGSSAYLSPFSLLGMPSIALPVGVRAGLPQAIQLAGRRKYDASLLKVASWCSELFEPTPTPPEILDTESGL